MADTGPQTGGDPEAVKRHPRLFRAARQRRNPRLRRSDITVTDERAVKRAVKAASLGNAMEWFDFGIYSYLAVTIGHVFFPSGNDTVQLLSSFATFAVAFLVRPLGGMFFGPMGDRLGRKKVLALTMILMALGTFCIGLIPSYASIGFWAPLLLILFRLVQGFSTGGEYGGASTFIAEYAPDKRRGFFGSFLELGTLLGYTGAAGLVTALYAVLDDGAMESWGGASRSWSPGRWASSASTCGSSWTRPPPSRSWRTAPPPTPPRPPTASRPPTRATWRRSSAATGPR